MMKKYDFCFEGAKLRRVIFRFECHSVGVTATVDDEQEIPFCPHKVEFVAGPDKVVV